MVAVAAGAVHVVVTVLIGRLSQRFPDDTGVVYARRIAGRFLGWTIGSALALGFAAAAVADLVVASLSISMSLLNFTPAPAVVALGVLPAGYWAWTGWARMGRLSPVLLLILLTTTGVAGGLLGRAADWGYLRPLFDWSMLRPQSRDFWVGLLSLHSAFALAMVVPGSAEPERATRSFLAGTAVGWLVVALYTVMPVAIFGPEAAEATSHAFPDVLGVIFLFGSPFARPEFIAVVVYQINTLAALAIFIWLGACALAQLAGRPDPRPFVAVITVVVAAIAGMIVRLGGTAFEVAKSLNVSIYGLVPLWGLLWILYWLRRQRQAVNRSPPSEPVTGGGASESR